MYGTIISEVVGSPGMRLSNDVMLVCKEIVASSIKYLCSFPDLPSAQFLEYAKTKGGRGEGWYDLSCEWCQFLDRQEGPSNKIVHLSPFVAASL